MRSPRPGREPTSLVRGEVFRLRLPRGTRRSEQRGARHAVVVQADELLVLSTVLVSPTSTSAPPRSFRPTIDVRGTATRVLVEQTTAISPDRLGTSVGRLSAGELRDVDAALALVLGL
jgi:mRNA interferase MazF